ncbi:MAG: hypothetical protein LBR85_06775 [Oscillospiraceae bacterium]|nr:hypothetical protein [Oscillospiraceae bacterium]
MKLSKLHIPVAICAGVIAFILRALSLTGEYDAQTGLVGRGAPFDTALAILCAAVFAALMLFVPKERKKRPKSTMPLAFAALEILAAGALAASGVVSLVRFFGSGTPDSGRVATLVLGVLSILAAAAIDLLAQMMIKKPLASNYGIYLTVPVFWACYNLILDFWKHSGSPVLSDYAYMLFAFVAVTLAVFGASARFYQGSGVNRLMPVFAASGVVFSLVALCGPAMKLIAPNSLSAPKVAQMSADYALIMVFILLHCLALLWVGERNALDGNFVPKPKDGAVSAQESGFGEGFEELDDFSEMEYLDGFADDNEEVSAIPDEALPEDEESL